MGAQLNAHNLILGCYSFISYSFGVGYATTTY